jgi:hypothetical protein
MATRSPLAPTLAAAALLAACNPTVSFDTTVKGSSTIPGSNIPGVLQIPANLAGLSNVSFAQQANLANNNTDKDHVDHVRVKSMTLTVTSPSGQDLSFLQTLSFFVSAPNQAQVRIAHQETFPKGVSSVQMTLDNVDLAPYAKADSFSITTQGSGTAPSQDTTIEAAMVLTIDAHLL